MDEEPLTVEKFTKEWKHFLSCIDFNKTNLDADAIRFMNEPRDRVLPGVWY